MRADKKKSLSKVTKELLKNPIQTVREVAEKTWVSKSTVANYINENMDELGHKNKDIIQITDTDLEILKLWQQEIFNRLQKKEELEKMRTFEIAQTIEKSEKRYQIFRWDVTDKDWWLKDSLDEEQIKKIAKLALWI